MALDFTRIPQNSRTIIFERFNDQAPNLCTLLKGQEADEAIVKIDEELCVKSFEQFKEVFKPTVYEVFQQDESGNLQVTYSLEICKGAHPVSLCEHEFYKAVHDIALEKSASNVNNDNINYTKLYEALDPKNIYTRARRRRDDVKQFVKNALEAQEKGDPDRAIKWINMAKQTHCAVKDEYAGSALRILPLVVRDTEMLLEGRGIKNDDIHAIESGAKPPELLPCSIKWDSDGNIQTVPLENLENNKPDSLALEQKEQKVLQITQKNWEKTVNEIPEGQVDKNLFLSVYSEQENTALAQLPTEQLLERRKIFGDMYVAAQQSFCNAVGYLVQKVVSVEQFFIHAGDDNGIVESGVIIANCSVSDVMENERYIRSYLKTARNNEKDKIWFAILPAAIDKDKKWAESGSTSNVNIDIFNMDIFAQTEENKTTGIETISVADINNISSLLAEFDILSFFNFNACEKTSFKTFGANTDIIEEYNKEISGIKRTDSVVLAYPNFTIIPNNKRQIEMINDAELYTPAVYVDAAYVAAGIVVATQNAKIQKKKFGKKVAPNRPFIRFDIEEEKNSKEFGTKFNPESRLNMDKDVTALLFGKDGNAFCFRSDSLENSAFVFTARTLNAKQIYQFLTQKYFSFLLERTYTRGKLTAEEAKKFANSISNITSNESDETIVNQLLHKGEEFVYNETEKQCFLKFRKQEELVSVGVIIADDEN